MVEEEAEQFQVIRSEVATQEEVAAQATVEVLHQGAGTDHFASQLFQDRAEVIEATAELLAQGGFLLPALRPALIEGLEIKQLARDRDVDLELRGDGLEIAVELRREVEQVVALLLQHVSDRLDAVRAQRFAGAQLGDDEVEQLHTLGMFGAGDAEYVVLEPACQ